MTEDEQRNPMPAKKIALWFVIMLFLYLFVIPVYKIHTQQEDDYTEPYVHECDICTQDLNNFYYECKTINDTIYDENYYEISCRLQSNCMCGLYNFPIGVECTSRESLQIAIENCERLTKQLKTVYVGNVV